MKRAVHNCFNIAIPPRQVRVTAQARLHMRVNLACHDNRLQDFENFAASFP